MVKWLRRDMEHMHEHAIRKRKAHKRFYDYTLVLLKSFYLADCEFIHQFIFMKF